MVKTVGVEELTNLEDGLMEDIIGGEVWAFERALGPEKF